MPCVHREHVAGQNLLLKSLNSKAFEQECVALLKDIVKSKKGDETAYLQFLKSLIPYVTSNNGLRNLVYLFVRKTSDVLDQILKDTVRSSLVLPVVQEFWALTFSHQQTLTHKVLSTEESSTELVDVLPSLASIYMDLFIAVHSSKEKVRKLSKHLCGSLMFELNERCLKTALLEVSSCTPQAVKLLMPLLRKLLLSPVENSHLDYLLHTVVCQRWSLVSDTLREEIEGAPAVKAPSNFVDWLSTRWPAAKSYFPLDKSLKGRRVTEVMMSLDQAAIDQLIDVFSQCLWSTQQDDQSQDSNVEVAMETEQSSQLFVIDKKGGENIADSQEPPEKKRKRVLSENNDLEEEITKKSVDGPKKKCVSIADAKEEGEFAASDTTSLKKSERNRYRHSKDEDESEEDGESEVDDETNSEGSSDRFEKLYKDLQSSKEASEEAKNEFIDLSDGDDIGVVNVNELEGIEEESEDDEEEEGGDEDNDSEEEDDDNDKDEGGDDVQDEEDESSEDEQHDDGSEEKEADEGEEIDGSEDDDFEDEIMSADNSTVYTYKAESKSPRQDAKMKKNLTSAKGPSEIEQAQDSFSSVTSSNEPSVVTIDGMAMTIYDNTAQEEDLNVKPDQAIEESVTKSIKAIRDSLGESGRKFRRSKSRSESDTGESLTKETGDKNPEKKALAKKDKTPVLKDWMRRSSTSDPSPTVQGDDADSTNVNLQIDEEISFKPPSPKKRKSAADFFKIVSSSPASVRSPSPSKQVKVQEKPSSKKQKLLSSSQQETDQEKTPVRKLKILQQRSSSMENESDIPSSPTKSTKKTTSVKKKSKTGFTPDSPTATSHSVLSEDLQSEDVNIESETPKRRRKKSPLIKKVYYLRNLHTPKSEHSPQSDAANHKQDEEQTSPFTSVKKRKRTKSEPIASPSPKKSPANRRKSLRSATKAK